MYKAGKISRGESETPKSVVAGCEDSAWKARLRCRNHGERRWPEPVESSRRATPDVAFAILEDGDYILRRKAVFPGELLGDRTEPVDLTSTEGLWSVYPQQPVAKSSHPKAPVPIEENRASANPNHRLRDRALGSQRDRKSVG